MGESFKCPSGGGWEVKVDEVESCGKAPKNIKVVIGQYASRKINILMSTFKNIEWLAYLQGIMKPYCYVGDIFIPKQDVTSVSVTNIDTSESVTNCIGVIHSHHSMGNTFSHTDDEWINKNNDISLCVSNSGIKGTARWKTPCGAILNVPVKIEYDINEEDSRFIKVAKERINVKTFSIKKYITPAITFEEIDDSEYEEEDDDLDIKELDNLNKEMTLAEELAMMEQSGMFNDEDYN